MLNKTETQLNSLLKPISATCAGTVRLETSPGRPTSHKFAGAMGSDASETSLLLKRFDMKLAFHAQLQVLVDFVVNSMNERTQLSSRLTS